MRKSRSRRKKILDLIEKIKRKDEDLRGLLTGKALSKNKVERRLRRTQKGVKKRQAEKKKQEEILEFLTR